MDIKPLYYPPLSRDRISRDEMFSMILKVIEGRSTCLRSQVAALIVKDGRIISLGYNGPVSGVPACTRRLHPLENQFYELEDLAKLQETQCQGQNCNRSIHAEINAIAFAARSGSSVDGCTLYCSMSPCINCAKAIVNSGIKEVKYLKPYRDTLGLKLLKQSGIEVKWLSKYKDGILTLAYMDRGDNTDEEN